MNRVYELHYINADDGLIDLDRLYDCESWNDAFEQARNCAVPPGTTKIEVFCEEDGDDE